MTFIITDQQLAQLNNMAVDDFLDTLVIRCKDNFPYLNTIIADKQLKNALTDRVSDAEKVGFNEKGGVRLYTELAVILGIEFEDDPQYSWIKDLLNKNRELSQIDQADSLWFDVDRYLDAAYGPDDEYLVNSAKNIIDLNLEFIRLNEENLSDDLALLLEKIFPEKVSVTDEKTMEQLMLKGIERARQDYRLVELHHIAMIVMLTFILGYRFDINPFYSWIDKIKLMNNVHNLSSISVADCLQEWLVTWANCIIQHHGMFKNREPLCH